MRIGIDTRGYIIGKNHGIGNYCVGLWSALVKHKEHTFVLLHWGEKSLKEELFENDVNVEEYIAGEKPDKMEVARAHILLFLRKYKVDIFYDTCPTLGLTYDKAWFTETILVATVYDYIPYVLRDEYFQNNAVYKKYIGRIFGNLQYDRLFSISENTRMDAIKILDINPSEIVNISMDVNYSADHAHTGCPGFMLPDRFIMSAVWINVHKNVPRLLEGYGKAYMQNHNIPDLILTGEERDEYKGVFDEVIARYDIKRKVHFLGFIKDEEMDYLYSRAEWVIFPSLYEGFGMSVLEAWRHRVPVITSDNSSLYEIAHDAAITVNPTDVDEICNGIIKAIEMNEEERREYIEAGVNRGKEFSWDITAELFLEYISKWVADYKYEGEIYVSKMRKIAEGIKRETRHFIRNKYVRECEKKYKDCSQIIVFGAGNNGKKCVEILRSIGIYQVAAFCDNYYKEEVMCDIPVLELAECKKKFPNAYYIITPKISRMKIQKQLHENGINDECISFFESDKI